MPRGKLASRTPEYAYEPITSIDAADRRAGLGKLAAFVDLSGGDAGQTNSWTFGKPDWAVTVPNGGRSAFEGCSSGDDLECDEDHEVSLGGRRGVRRKHLHRAFHYFKPSDLEFFAFVICADLDWARATKCDR